jgi:hypothetical protein
MKAPLIVMMLLILSCRAASARSDDSGLPPENDASQMPDKSVISSAAAIKLPDLDWTTSNPVFSLPLENDASQMPDKSVIPSGASIRLPDLNRTTPGPDFSPAPARTLSPPIESNYGFKWKAATIDSFNFLMLQNVARIAFQSKTRHALKGPFFKDYIDTLTTAPSGFTDGDSWFTNYYLHPVQGAASYHLARVNGASRTQAFFWGIAYSTQFELGPVGEGTIGNVPISPVDLVVTPTVGYALGLTEEWLVKKLDATKHPAGRVMRLLLLGRLLTRVTSGK